MAQDRQSVIEKIKALREQESKLLESAKSELLEQGHKVVQELAELGFSFRLVEESAPARAPAKTSGQKREQKDAPCPICNFKTSPLHDGRAHRSQEPKKPFTAAELSERGLKRVD